MKGSRMHSNNSLQIARMYENECMNLVKAIGLSVRNVDSKTDIHDHIDFKIVDPKNPNKEYGVDVKNNKIYTTNDGEKYRFVEIINVNGSTGSLYGKADYIAFKEDDGYIFVCRWQLAHYVKDNLNTSKILTSFYPIENLYFHQYRSHSKTQNRKDIITLIKLSDLRKFIYFKVFTDKKIETHDKNN